MSRELLRGSHDLRLGDWGPFSKKYIGLSHIADAERGARFDLCAAPGFYRRKTVLPNVRWECGYHPWESSADLSVFTHRHELEWKDQVYSDISFAPYAPQMQDLRLMRVQMVNNTDTPQNLTLHLFASLHYPPHHPASAVLPADGVWVDAVDFTNLCFAKPRPQDGLVWDGLRRGQIRAGGFVNATGIGQNFGQDAGDRAAYSFVLARELPQAGVLLRYRLAAGKALRLELTGALRGSFDLCGTGEFAAATLATGPLPAGEHSFAITSQGGAGIELDGFALAPCQTLGQCAFPPAGQGRQPQVRPGPVEQSLVLQYPDLPQAYALWWSEGDYTLRQHFMDELEPGFYDRIHNHVSDTFRGAGEGHFSEVFLRPLVLQPHSQRVIYGLVAQGEGEAAGALLAGVQRDAAALEERWQEAAQTLLRCEGNADGAAHETGQRLMAATTMLNCVYPAFAKGRHIRHHTPGRWWDSLYSWDSGFIGLGLLELDLERAVDNLNAYLSDPGDPECAFIHHGSPVPVQHYLFHELCNRTQDRSLLAYFYPRLKQYHEFLAGRAGGSDTRLPSGLLATWSYFYNSGGWDDYPPQHYFHAHRSDLGGRAAPAVNTAHAIRTAKILAAAATDLGLTQDIAAYETDIRTFTQALETHSWDEAAGYYGYVRHDESGQPQGLFRHDSGANFNMGLDGLTPLVADICSPERRAEMYRKLQDPARLWTPIGISTVDQAAPYYRRDGYWNGAVWMPHQWFIWKAALDHGQGDFAWRIADTALKLWSAETGNSYNCFEHFIIASGRGAGWHQFGGLSTPVLSWFSAYYRPGRLSTGLNGRVLASSFTGDGRELQATLRLSGACSGSTQVLATLRPGTYRATWNGEAAPCQMRTLGCCEITLPAQGEGVLAVRPQ